ncbi:hypothetical protein Tco_0871979 [Tanacetum coccineum]
MMTTGTRMPWSSHGGCGGNGDGDDGGGSAKAMAWLSVVVTGTVVVARGIGGGRRKYSPEKFSGGDWPEFNAGF